MAPPRPAHHHGPAAWRRRPGARAHLGSLVLAGLLGAWAAQRHLAWAAADRSLPVGDAPGHVMIAVRWWRWWTDLALTPPSEPFPPLVYFGLAWARLQGPGTFDQLHLAMAAWSGLLVGGAAWAAARAGGGLAGAALAGLLVLHAPHTQWVARQFLLDGPALAAVLLTLGAAWWSRGLSRPLPALAAGLGAGLVVLTKHSLLIWLVGPALVWLLALLRRPTALLPLVGWGTWAAWWLDALWQRRLARGPVELPAAVVDAHGGALLLLLVVALLVGAGPRRRWGGLAHGLCAALAAQATLALAVGWLWWGGAAAWEKIQREALHEVRAAGGEAAWQMVLTHLSDGLPLTGLLLLVGAIALAAGPRRSRLLALQALAALAGGAWLLSRALPLDLKYYAPVVPLAALGLGAALGGWRRARPLAWVLVAGLLLAPLVPGLPTPVVKSDARPQAAWRLLLPRLARPVPPPPVADDWEGAASAAAATAQAAWTGPARRDCQGYELAAPSLRVVEDRAFAAAGALVGLQEEHWARPPPGARACGGITVLATGEVPRELLANPDPRWPEPPSGELDVLAEWQPAPWARVLAWQRPAR